MRLDCRHVLRKQALAAASRIISFAMELIPLTKPYFSPEDIREIQDSVDIIMRSGTLVQGTYTEAFEASAARFAGTRFAIAMNAGASALQAALEYLEVRSSEVILSANSFLSVPNAVLFAGGHPVFADIHPSHLHLDINELTKKTTDRTKAVIVSHTAGMIHPHIHRIRNFCYARGIFLIEDASHALGSARKGRCAGSFGYAGIFSTHANHLVTTAGTGGFLVTNDKALAMRARSVRAHGEDKIHGIQDRIGHNWLMNELQAAVGLRQLANLSSVILQRMRIAQLYNEAFADLPLIDIVKPAAEDTCGYHAYLLVVHPALDAEEVRQRLEDDFSIQTGSLWPPCHLQPAYRSLFGYHKGDFPIAETILRQTIALPIYAGLSDTQVARVTDAMRAIFIGKRGYASRNRMREFSPQTQKPRRGAV